MKLEGRRESANVEDRRSSGGGKMAGLAGGAGILGVIVYLLTTVLGGGSIDPSEILGSIMTINPSGEVSSTGEFSEEEQALAKFSSQVLASTEDVWTAEFAKMGKTYRTPTLVLYTGSTSTKCGQGQSAMGPFYCSADEKVYIDLSFFMTMKKQLGADGDFAYAYVIAHEVGHHVQHLLGDLDREHQKMRAMSEKEANGRSVRIELQADFYAGVWGYHENKKYGSLEDGDLQEALDCAQKIGDDYLQKKAQGYAIEDSFTHGKAEQRFRWLKKGLTTGDMSLRDTFTIPESKL